MVITIVGLGVIGGSYALALEPFKFDIYGIDINELTLKNAKEMGIITDGAVYGSENSEQIISKTDLLVLCVYPNDIKSFITKYKKHFKDDLIITDTTGIKSKFINEVVELLPEGVDFVFAHPMAGREKRGLEYASEYIFRKANFIITPIPSNTERGIEMVEGLAYDMRFKRVMKVSPKEHDEIISFTSQLPHAIAVSLINSDNLEVNTGAFIGDSYRELTRIANINEDLWSELFLGNKDNLIERIDEFQEQLSVLKKYLIEDKDQELKALFRESSRRRETLE